MSDSRINRLAGLLESKNQILRNEAAAQLSQFPLSNDLLRRTLRKLHQSPSWDARAAAAQAFGLLLLRISGDEGMGEQFRDYEAQGLQDLDLDDVLLNYKILLSCEEVSLNKESQKLSQKEQRKLVDQHLELNAQTGVSCRSFLVEADLYDTEGQSTSAIKEADDSKKELSSIGPDEATSKANDAADVDERELNKKLLEGYVADLLTDLVSPRWQLRHGSSLALTKVVAHSLPLLPPECVERIAIRILQALTLDRFNDFMTGSNAVAPVRESTAQALSMLILRLHTSFPGCQLVRSMVGHLQVLLLMDEEKNWPCRQTALIALKYYFSMCESGAETSQLFEAAVVALSDPVDEVISMAVHSVSSLFANQRILAGEKSEMIRVVMRSVWSMLTANSADPEAQVGFAHSEISVQLSDNVSSLLVDLLEIIQMWLSVDSAAQLQPQQFEQIAALVDPTHCTRSVRAMECICAALPNSAAALNDQQIFFALKILYRCVLFAQPSDSAALMPLAFTTLMSVVALCTPEKIGLIPQLQSSIGFWTGCLVYDHRNCEIDVFAHNVNGPNSATSTPVEILCGDEARFLDDAQKNAAFMERKCLAARFLSPLIDALYRSGAQLQDQSIHLSLQLHFIPYLRSNSLYQRMGCAIVVNCWARMFRRAYNAGRAAAYPTVLTPEVERVLAEAAQRAPYDEVATMVNALTNECNEFRRHCISKGVPAADCPAVESGKSMEEVVDSLYSACIQRLQKPADIEALNGRRNYLSQLIDATKLEIRTNTNRLNCLCSSILLYLGVQPTQLTPLIRPLIEATDTEDVELLAEECFYDSFVILLSITAQRQPCPHPKILKQLATGLQQCALFTPVPNSTKSDELVILSGLAAPPPDVPAERRARNCQRILQKLGEQLGAALFDVVPGLLAYMQLEAVKSEAVTVKVETAESNAKAADVKVKAEAEPVKSESSNGSETKIKTESKNGNSEEMQNPDDGSLPSTSGEANGEHFDGADEPISDADLPTFLCNLEFVRLLVATTGHRPSAAALRRLRFALRHPDAAVRFRASRCAAELAATDLPFALNSLYSHLSAAIEQVEDRWARAGAVELITLLTHRLAAADLITVAPLFAPKALAAISDREPAIRELAAVGFGRLVALLHLDAKPNADLLDRIAPQIRAEISDSADFVNVLSAPSRLPSLTQQQIPRLRAGFDLRSYQLEGITWLAFLRRFHLNGILADDMGLGKTIQTLSLLSMAIHEPRRPANGHTAAPSLIVCPKTLVQHWVNEWRQYFPTAAPMQTLETYSPKRFAKSADVLVLSYEELRGNIRTLGPIAYLYVVLDEGHCIRNPTTQLFEAIESLRTRHKLLLSGTPVQNSPADLWALFRFLMPGYLFSRAVFQSRFLRPILSCRSAKASGQQTKEGEEALSHLHRLILPFVLRRLKSDVLKELPDKVVQDWPCQLTSTQHALYSAIVEKCALMKRADANGAEATKKPKAETEDSSQRLSTLHTLIALRQLVDHPLLVAEVLHKIGWTDKRTYDPNGPNAASLELSGKFVALKEILQECQIGESDDGAEAGDADIESMPTLSQHRALIFCQWRSSIELVARLIDDGSLGAGIRYLRLDGTVPAAQRQSVADRFNSDPTIDVLLVTTHVGGVGLTLTGADVVIFLDHDWNPVKDLQAVDRAHRLGQTRTVNVFRLITSGSIEEKVMQFQKFKRDTADALVGADNQSISSMGSDELLELFTLADSTAASAQTSDSAPPPKRGRRKAPANSTADDQWSMDELWDSSQQYEDSHNVRTFMDESGLR